MKGYFWILAFVALVAGAWVIGEHSDASLRREAPSVEPAYNVTFSKTVLAYGVLSYCPKKCLENWSCDFGKGFPKLINVTHSNDIITEAAAYIGYEPESRNVYISWRGSANVENWISDFTFPLEPFSGCKGCYVHVGFNEDYKLTHKKLDEALDKLLKAYDVNRIVVTGHSMGAAVASIHGLRLAMLNLKPTIQVHQFGSPRVGNENLAQFIHLKVPNHYRVVHNRDLVPHLPPDFGYKHAPYEILFDKEFKNYTVCNESGEDPACSNRFFPEYTPVDHDFYFIDLGTVKC